MKIIGTVIFKVLEITAFLVTFTIGWVIKYAVFIVLGFIAAFFFNR